MSGSYVHLLRNDLASNSSNVVKVSVPELQYRLSFKPSLDDEQAIDHACLVFFPASFLGRRNDLPGDDGAVCFRDLPFLQLTGNHLFNLVLQSQCDFCDVFCRESGRREVGVVGRQDFDSVSCICGLGKWYGRRRSSSR